MAFAYRNERKERLVYCPACDKTASTFNFPKHLQTEKHKKNVKIWELNK